MEQGSTIIEYVESSAYTCGLCNGEFDKALINQHTCLQGYSQLWINQKNNFFYPLLDDNITVVTRTIEGNENRIPYKQLESETAFIVKSPSNLKKKRFSNLSPGAKRDYFGLQSSKNFTHEDEEDLILEVKERESLWNNRLPIEERSIRVRSLLWQEVSDALGGRLTADGAKAKFKNLWDSFRRIVHAENSSKNGSAKKDSKRKWHHYESMEFLRDSCLLAKRSTSNTENLNDSMSNDNSHDMTNLPQTKNNKKSKIENVKVENLLSSSKTDDIVGSQETVYESELDISTGQSTSRNTIAWERIADALCSSQTNNETLPLIPQRDEIDSILHVINCRVRNIPRKKAMLFLNKFFLESCNLENDV
ncbi:uncharacterized protein LOC122861044 [Aphidius gifuensis]|uniref:uncharacterized protein LOC122861044 n=1 Tax=Aphidius gifuensis TaxID=684658 RepID=UPI001CDB9047|nr:uncharacterized protein LOC122861044 [Aphidius gifuensis]